MKYDSALRLANVFLEKLRPACLRIEIVGSTKRADKKSLADGVHDLEFLIIPKPGHPTPEWGQPNIYMTYLDKLLADLEYQELIRQANDKKDGDRYKKRAIRNTVEMNEFCMDLFIVTPETWGMQNLIRSGPSWFSHRSVTNQNVLAWNRETGAKASGFLPNNIQYIRAKESPDKLSHLKSETGEWLDISEEQGVFNLIFGKWIPPSERREYAEIVK